jgi:hypothetical protein
MGYFSLPVSDETSYSLPVWLPVSDETSYSFSVNSFSLVHKREFVRCKQRLGKLLPAI